MYKLNKSKKKITDIMFNSIKKDENRRRLVKRFEIIRLQNKVLVEAISTIQDNQFFIKKLGTRKILFQEAYIYNIQNINSVNILPHTTNFWCLPSAQGVKTHVERTDIFDTKSFTVPHSIAFINSDGKRIDNSGDTLKPKIFYNNNIIIDPQLSKSSLYLFAKKKKIDYIEKLNNNVKQHFSIFETVKTKQSNALVNNSKHCDRKLVSHKKYIPRNSSINRVKNRCIETGRSHSVLRFCKLSRICLRDKASKGNISGVNKASW